MGDNEPATVRTLTAYRELMTDHVTRQHGRIVDFTGDNLLAEFPSVVDAVECAATLQQELVARNAELPENRRMQFRIGINLGEVLVEGDRIYGDEVNIAARIQGVAEADGICVSGMPVSADAETRSTADLPSIAVLPFDNMSQDPEQEHFSDGLTEDLITDLSKVPGLTVAAGSSVFTYKGTAVNVQAVGRELGVRYVLEGSVRKAGDRVRITAQLADAATGHHVWAERYDRELDDVFALQDEIVARIVAELVQNISEEGTGQHARS
jgi:adenylate cyclase